MVEGGCQLAAVVFQGEQAMVDEGGDFVGECNAGGDGVVGAD